MPADWILVPFVLVLCLFCVSQAIRKRSAIQQRMMRWSSFRALRRFIRGKRSNAGAASSLSMYLRLAIVPIAIFWGVVLAFGIVLGSTSLFAATTATLLVLLFAPATVRAIRQFRRPSLAQIMLLVTSIAISFALISQLVDDRRTVQFALLSTGAGVAAYFLSYSIALNFKRQPRDSRINGWPKDPQPPRSNTEDSHANPKKSP